MCGCRFHREGEILKHRFFSVRNLTAVFLFVACFTVGLKLASIKPLWNDEVFSQVSQIQKLSYWDMLFTHPGEGNLCPLFYMAQKAISQIFLCSLPDNWDGSPVIDA